MKPVRNLLLLLVFLGLFACKKESFTSSPASLLYTSVDTLHYDTVFTTTGSVTQYLKIFNDNDKGIHISSVKLSGGNNSPFHISVDGTPGPVVSNIDLAAHDSLYIFVTVSVNPSNSTPAFLVQDSIIISYNGNEKQVQLDAYGQNAHFLRNKKITGSETWNNALPYVILGGLTVDTNATLTINQGCHIYMHADAPFIIHGSLKVNGDKWDSTRVVFTGDRLDEPYRDFPASYPGLIFTGVSKANELRYVIIKNAYNGIVLAEHVTGTKLILNETIIDNAYEAGLTAINSSISARNVLISNCGKNILLLKGGDYQFTHCTVASYSNNFIQHKYPVLYLTNFLNVNGSLVSQPLNATFRNCIFWGESNGYVPNEVVLIKQPSPAPSLIFDHVLWRLNTSPSDSYITEAINNQDPLFDSVNTNSRIFSFGLKENSPALNKGIDAGVSLDLNGQPRPVGLPDLGAYERQ